MKRMPWVGLLCMLPLFAGAAGFARTPQEEAMCQAVVYSRDTSDHENWAHMHHYCDCIRFTNRAYSALGDWYTMRVNLEVGIGGCDYVLRHAKPDFYMRPEVHLQKGKALRLYRQEGKAIAEFTEAIKGNPQLARAYVELADIQANNKKPRDALKTVTDGLRHAPDSRPLKRRYSKLGGKLPYPEAVVQKAGPAPESSPPPQQALPEAAPPSTTAVEANPPALAADKPVDAPAAPTRIEPAKIGSPPNPYCRFCPD